MGRTSKPLKLYDVHEVATLLGYKGPDVVRRLIERGEIKAVDVGAGKRSRILRVSEESLQAFLAARTVKPTPPVQPVVKMSRARAKRLERVTKYF